MIQPGTAILPLIKKYKYLHNYGRSALWAYIDGSCIGKAENFVGAGVYCPQTKAS
jgi:hypothetical protein